MNLIILAVYTFAAARSPADSVGVARRIAASAQLAAQEYRNGVTAGHVVAPQEVAEARLFLTNARQSAQVLSTRLAAVATAGLDRIAALVDRTASPDSIAAAADQVTADLGAAVGSALDELPPRAPSLARGAEIYRRECQSCHGELGRGDGAAGRVLDPPPANLAAPPDRDDITPLSYFQRISIGTAGTAMPAFETRLSAADRWAVALYASTLRQAQPSGPVPPALQDFARVAVMTDSQVLAALGAAASRQQLAAVREYQPPDSGRAVSAAVFASVRDQIAGAVALARNGHPAAASDSAFGAYMEFEKVEGDVRARDATLASDLETAFATLRARAAGGATAGELDNVQRDLGALLERAERVVSDRMSATNLFIQSLVIMLREGFEAILIIGALIAFLVKAGASHRRRDIHIGVGAAIAMSLLTAVLLETVFVLSSAHREALEGATMLVAVVVLFYVSYWLLSKVEVAKWTAFVKRRLSVAVTGGSAFALASAAFLAVYREGFETVLFYKALLVEAGPLSATFLPVTAGIALGAAALTVVYIAINRWGMKIPLRPFFAATSAFLYYMAFVFAGKGIAELQEGRLVSETILLGWPRFPALGIYPTVESMLAQGVLLALALVAMVWLFGMRRFRQPLPPVTTGAPAPPLPDDQPPGDVEATMLRSLERMDADLSAMKSEVERMRQAVVDASVDDTAPH